MSTQVSHTSRRAVTLIELLAVLVVMVIVFGAMLPVLGRTTHCGNRQMRDSMNVRGTTQAFVVWASSNNGSYPLPSELDLKNDTIAGLASTKDTTGNILSVLIMNGSIAPEMLVSSVEVNPRIARYDNYQYTTPASSANPQNALWDPAFRGTPDDVPANGHLQTDGFGHQSFAHAIPFGRRKAVWTDTYNSTEAIFGNRGPTYAVADAAPASSKWSLLTDPSGNASNTLLMHGGRNTWEGNIAFNDNHVEFITTPTPSQVTLNATITGKPGKAAPMADNLFVNETNELNGDGATGRVDQGLNAYLRPIADVLERARPRVWRD